MSTLLQDIDQYADWASAAMWEVGYNADFTGPSLWELDRFFDNEMIDGHPRRGGPLDGPRGRIGTVMFGFGSYLGEVIRRTVGGEWQTDESSPRGEVDIQLTVPDGRICWPVQRVISRFAEGPENGIAAYALVLGVPVGPWPSKA